MGARSTGMGTEAHDMEGIFEVPRRAVGKDRRSLVACELTSPGWPRWVSLGPMDGHFKEMGLGSDIRMQTL